MTTSNADIQRLIDRFMSGKTSLDEEARLAAYFRTHDVPEEWADYKAMFAYFDAGMPAGNAAGSGKAAATVAIVPWWRKAARWAAAAAVIAAVAAAALHVGLTTDSGNAGAGSPQRPTVAQTEAAEPAGTTMEAAKAAGIKGEPHIAQAVKAKAKSEHSRRPQAHEALAASADGVAEYSHMVVAADYDQWVSRLDSDINAQQAMALMEQGAAVAVMCSDYGDAPEVP